ncbi:MAG: triple tyrosine motif-containing protein [bacterium]
MSRWTRYRLLGVALLAAAAAFSQDRPGWFTRAWQSDVGLPDNTVVGIDLAPDGFLWVATPAGLVRFDGLRFQPFAAVTAAGGAANLIQAMWVDRSGRLWLAKECGTVICVDQGTTTVMTVAEGVPNLVPETTAVDSAGGVWLSYVGGKVVRIQEGRVRAFTEADGLPGGGTCQLTSDADGHVWFSQGGWVGVYRDGRFRQLAEVKAQCITAAKAGGIWICTGKELSRYTEGGSLKKVGDLPTALPEVTPTVLHEDRSATFLWIGTKEAGLFRYSGIVVKVTEHQQILSVKSDQQGNVWIGTRGGGLNQLKPKAVELLSPASPIEFVPVRSLCQDMTDTRWIVTQNGMVWRSWGGGWVPLSDDGWTFSDAQCVIAASLSGVWIGTQTHGLHHWQDKALITSLTPANGLAGDSVSALLAVPSGALWIGVGASDRQHHALQCWQAGQFRTFPLPAASGPVTAMALDSAGDCWAATFSGLLVRVRGNELTDETSKTLAEPNAIRCLLVTPDNSLWIGYGGQGLGRLKAGRFSRCRMEQGLYDDYISQILPDSRGRLWFAGNRGIFSVFQSELDELAEGRALRVRSVAYGSNDGLPRLQASHDFWPGALRTTTKHLLFAMESGLADVYAAELFEENKEAPPVVIERVSVNGKAVAAYGADASLTVPGPAAPTELWGGAPHLRLSPGPRQLEFAFTALNFTKPEDIGFKYRLHPLDKDWMDAGTRRVASYPQVPPGDYRFEVLACNSSGVWNPTGAALELMIEPYWWETAWSGVAGSLAVVGLLLAGILLFLRGRYRRKIERLELQQAMGRERARIAADLHDEIGANLSHISILNTVAAKTTTEVTESRQYCSEAGDVARQTIRAFDEILWSVNPKNDTLQSLSSYICRYAEETLAPVRVTHQFTLDESFPDCAVPPRCRHSLFLAVKEALHNIVKHAGATRVELQCKMDGGVFVVRVADNGRGFDPKTGSAAAQGRQENGLENMRSRLSGLGGECRLESHVGRGTQVTFRVPLA